MCGWDKDMSNEKYFSLKSCICRRRLLVLVVAIFTGMISQAQYPDGISKSVDSLKFIYDKVKEDTTKIELLKKWSGLIATYDVDGARDLNLEILEIVEKQIDDDHINERMHRYFLKEAGSASLVLGNYEQRNGSADMALEYYRQARNYFIKCGDHKGCAKSYFLMSNEYMQTGNFPAATRTAFRAIAQNIKGKDPEGLCDCYMQLGQILAMQGQLDSALAQMELAANYCGKGGNADNVSAMNTGKGNVYLMQGNLIAAMHHYTAGLELSERRKDIASMTIALNNIGYVYTLQGNNLKAAESYKRGAMLTINSPDKVTQMNANFALASAYHGLKQLDSAMHCYRTIAEISSQLEAYFLKWKSTIPRFHTWKGACRCVVN